MRRILLGLVATIACLCVCLCAFIWMRTVSISHPKKASTDEAVQFINIDPENVALNLSRAIQYRTVTTQNRDDIQWQYFLDFQSWLLETYPDFHKVVNTEQVADYAQLHVWQGSDNSLAPIVFLAHQDVVPASEEKNIGWDYPPFDGVITDEFVYGRGAMDDKASLISMLEAANRLAAHGFKPKRTLMFAFGHDEEVGGRGAQAIAELLKARGVTPYAVIDEGGSITTGMSDVAGPVARIGVAEKGYLTLILTAKARGGHSSTPPPYTAIGGLSKAITAIENNPFESGLNEVSIAMLKATASEQSFKDRMMIANLWVFKSAVENKMRASHAGAAQLGTTIAPTIIDAGFKENALPREAVAYVNFRLHSRDSIESVTEHVRSAIDDSNIEINIAQNVLSEPSPISQIETGPYLWLKQVINQAYPGVIIAPNTVLGGTDSRFFALVTNDIYRFTPFVINASDYSRFHGLNERMRIDDFVKSIQVYYLLLENAGNGI